MSSTILAIDTSTEACSAAILTDDICIFDFDICPREHNQRILPMVKALLTEANLALDDIDAIGFGAGPGSFTGVRIATGIVQGLAFGANKKVLGVSSLAAMAHSAYRQEQRENVITAIDARMAEIYLAAYQVTALGQLELKLNEVVTSPEEALSSLDKNIDWHGVGTGWQTYHEVLNAQVNVPISQHVVFPHALDIAYIARQQFAQGEGVAAAHVSPSYLRNEVTWKKLPGRS